MTIWHVSALTMEWQQAGKNVPQASSMDVHNPHEACGYSHNGCTDARRPAYVCPFFVHSETLNFELMWRRKYKKKSKNVPEMLGGMAKLLQVGVEPERMLDLVVAWEDVALVKYDCSAMKFKSANT